MKIVSKGRLVPFMAILCSLLLANRCFAEAPAPAPAEASAQAVLEASLQQFLSAWDKESTSHMIAFEDLNEDGKLEAIVYLTEGWCGSGGCNTLILKQDGSSWKIVTNMTIVNLPIRVLATRSHGWHSIGVWVQGGGIQPGYEAELIFNGKTYPTNPTVPPARKLKGKPTGKVVLDWPKREAEENNL